MMKEETKRNEGKVREEKRGCSAAARHCITPADTLFHIKERRNNARISGVTGQEIR